jgi:hypothetical protein
MTIVIYLFKTHFNFFSRKNPRELNFIFLNSVKKIGRYAKSR